MHQLTQWQVARIIALIFGPAVSSVVAVGGGQICYSFGVVAPTKGRFARANIGWIICPANIEL
jgi:hypothetical protein